MGLDGWLGLFGYGIIPACMVIYALMIRFTSKGGAGRTSFRNDGKNRAVVLLTTLAFCVSIGLVVYRLLGSRY